MSKFICRVILSSLLSVLMAATTDAQVEIYEVLVDAPTSETEWMELFNSSSSPIDISCMVLSDGDFSITIPSTTMLAPGETFLIGSATTTGALANSLAWESCGCLAAATAIDPLLIVGNLNDGNEQLMLFNSAGQPTDGVVWGGGSFGSAPDVINIPSLVGCPPTILSFAVDPGAPITETITVIPNQSNAIGCSNSFYNDPNPTPGTTNSQDIAVPILVAAESSICQNESVNVDGSASLGVSSFTWNIPNATNVVNTSLTQTGLTFSASGNQTVQLFVSDFCSNPPVPISITIAVQQTPTITFASTIPAATSGDYDFCAGESFDLTATTTGNVQWLLNGSNISGANASTLTIDAAGSYSLTTVDALCTVTSTPVTVNEIPLPTAGITNTDLDFCINIPETIDAIAPTPPATTFDTYSWTTGSITGANSSQWNFPTNAAGTFNCQLVVTENGCDSDPLDFVVNVFDNPVVEISPSGPIDLCPDDQIILSSVNNHESYEWFLDGVSYATSPTINVSYNLAANAYLTATDNGCTETSATVDFISHPVATLATWTPPPYALDNRLRTCLLDHPILASSNGQQFQWYLDGNPILGETSLTINAAQDGDYYYTASTDGFCPIYSDTIAVDLEVDMTIETTASKDTACEGEIVQLIPEGEFVSYSWQGGIVADTLSVTNSGTYIVTGHLVSCSANDTVTVFFSPYPQVNAGEDFFSDCEDFTLLFGRTDGDESYWEIDGIEAGLGDTITIETPRRTSDLVLISSLNGCESRDTVNMKVDCIYIFAPTAITPDGDGLNDVFRVYANGLSSYILRIYNRFGQVVFETSNPDEVWTGGFNDYFLPNGVYTWQIEALDYNQQEALSKARSKGSILVVR